MFTNFFWSRYSVKIRFERDGISFFKTGIVTNKSGDMKTAFYHKPNNFEDETKKYIYMKPVAGRDVQKQDRVTMIGEEEHIEDYYLVEEVERVVYRNSSSNIYRILIKNSEGTTLDSGGISL